MSAQSYRTPLHDWCVVLKLFCLIASLFGVVWSMFAFFSFMNVYVGILAAIASSAVRVMSPGGVDVL